MNTGPDKLITVKTFAFVNDTAIIKGRLESEGIECFIKDEFTDPYYSNAVGGVKLQVKQKELYRAVDILLDAGYLTPEDVQELYPVDSGTGSNVFGLEKVKKPLLWAVVIVGAILFLFFKLQPSINNELINNIWCLDHITYLNKEYLPNTTQQLKIVFDGSFCEESLQLRENGKIVFPGFNTRNIWGEWRLVEDSIYITNIDTLQHVFEGVYKVERESNTIKLTSISTTIFCSKQ